MSQPVYLVGSVKQGTRMANAFLLLGNIIVTVFAVLSVMVMAHGRSE